MHEHPATFFCVNSLMLWRIVFVARWEAFYFGLLYFWAKIYHISFMDLMNAFKVHFPLPWFFCNLIFWCRNGPWTVQQVLFYVASIQVDRRSWYILIHFNIQYSYTVVLVLYFFSVYLILLPWFCVCVCVCVCVWLCVWTLKYLYTCILRNNVFLTEKVYHIENTGMKNTMITPGHRWLVAWFCVMIDVCGLLFDGDKYNNDGGIWGLFLCFSQYNCLFRSNWVSFS